MCPHRGIEESEKEVFELEDTDVNPIGEEGLRQMLEAVPTLPAFFSLGMCNFCLKCCCYYCCCLCSPLVLCVHAMYAQAASAARTASCAPARMAR